MLLIFFFGISESINIIGSDDVTTCIIIILRHSGKQNK